MTLELLPAEHRWMLEMTMTRLIYERIFVNVQRSQAGQHQIHRQRAQNRVAARYRILIVAFISVFGSQTKAAVRVDVNFDTFVTEIQPESKQFFGRAGTSFILQNNGQITRISPSGTSTNSLNGYVSTINRSGIGGVAHYSISHNTITEFYENEYVRDTITIETDGANFCQAFATSRPARGQKYIVWPNPTRYISSQKDINVTCRIKKTD